MFFKIIRSGYIQFGKLLPGITPSAVVRSQHICRHGFPKSSGTTHADKLLLRKQFPVYIPKQSALIDIYLRI